MTEAIINDVKKDFDKVISYSQFGIGPFPKTDELFKQWYAAKKNFIELFDDSLIVEWPEEISFELSNEEKQIKITNFIDSIIIKYHEYDLAAFIKVQSDGFYSNQVVSNYTYKETFIPKGMKLLKAFKYFLNNPEYLDEIQTAASMIIQENKISGKLCLSVHPLDFLSLSENNHNWRSCHALDGDYRSGNLSYMVDSSTIICYLKSKKDEKLSSFPKDVKWNSKKWRVLLFVSDLGTMLFAGRQYPFTTETGLNFVREKFLPSVGLGPWTEWTTDRITSLGRFILKKPYIAVKDCLRPIDDVVVNNPGSLQFNDLLSSSTYIPQYAFLKRDFQLPVSSREQVHIGGKCKCLNCGKNEIELSESMMCYDCELQYGESDSDAFGYCPCCGQRFLFDYGFWVESTQEWVCERCGNNYVEVCDYCGTTDYIENMIYDEDVGGYLCQDCLEVKNKEGEIT